MNRKINLQLFAAGDAVNKTTSATTGNNLSAEMKTFYDKTLITLASPNLVHAQFGQKRPIPKNGGKTIEFRKFSSLPKALNPITEGVTPTGNKLNVSSITATIDQYGDYVEQTDMLELTAIDNTIVESTRQLAAQAGLTMDTVVRNVLVGGTNVLYCPKNVSGTETTVISRAAIDSTAVLRVKDVFKAAAQLKAMNAPKIDGYYVGVIHPYVAYDLMQEAGTQWRDVQKYTKPENMLTGEIGALGGVRFVESTEAKIFRGADLASDGRTLAVNNVGGYTGAITSITFDGGTVAADSLNGRYIIINGVKAKVTDSTATTLTVESTNFGTVADNAVIYPGEGGAGGVAVFATLILGADAYGVIDVAGGGLEHIVKQKGYGNDPLNQRSSIGWKGVQTAQRLVEEYMIRVESGGSFGASATAN